jgi:hypothetical protein
MTSTAFIFQKDKFFNIIETLIQLGCKQTYGRLKTHSSNVNYMAVTIIQNSARCAMTVQK